MTTQDDPRLFSWLEDFERQDSCFEIEKNEPNDAMLAHCLRGDWHRRLTVLGAVLTPARLEEMMTALDPVHGKPLTWGVVRAAEDKLAGFVAEARSMLEKARWRKRNLRS